MNKKKLLILFINITFGVLIFSIPAYAVMPPDFIYNIGTQLFQIFSVIAIFLSVILTTSYQFIKVKLSGIKKPFWVISLGLIIIISGASAYLYGNYKQNAEYQKWLVESEKTNQTEIAKIPNKIKRETSIDKLIIENTEIKKIKRGEITSEKEKTPPKFTSYIENDSNDKSTKFIEDYYSAIANGDYEKAYSMSKKSTSLETFKSWYINTTQITLDKLVKIDESKSSLELTLFERNKYTRYGVLMTLNVKNGDPIDISKSEVKTLEEVYISTSTPESPIETIEQILPQENFYEQNKNKPLMATNEEFENTINEWEQNYIVLDAREDLEYENGNFPDSLHIRFADLQAGRWIELPSDKFVYVLCWSGIRGKEVAEFLREKNIIASYLENGANGWVAYGGIWDGNILFSEKYSEKRYRIVFSTDELKEKEASGVVLVDCREPWKYEDWHIPGSISFPIMYTPTIDLESKFSQIPAGSEFITICDNYVNCFDAKITGVKLEKQGNTFLGRYNKPWDY